MVAIIELDGQARKHLKKLKQRGSSADYSEAWRGDQWVSSRSHLAILVTDNMILELARARAGRTVSSRDRRISVTEISEITPPMSFALLAENVPEGHREALKRRGPLANADAEETVAALLRLRPDLRDLLTVLGRPDVLETPLDTRAEVRNQQRDAVGLLVDISLGSEGRKVLRNWQDPPEDAPFLDGIESTALEDSLIRHDIEIFGDWTQVPSARVGMKVFKEGRRRIYIMDVNRTSVERTLGVDVIYVNRELDSFVLVQ